MSIVGMKTIIRFPDGRRVLEILDTETNETLWIATNRSFVGNETTLLPGEKVLSDKMSAVHYLLAEKQHIWTEIKTHHIYMTPRGYYTEYVYKPSWYSDNINAPQQIWFVTFSKNKPNDIDCNVKVHWKILSKLMDEQSKDHVRMARVTKLDDVQCKVLFKGITESPKPEIVFRKITHSVLDREYHRVKTFTVPGYSEFFTVKMNSNEINRYDKNIYSITEKTTGLKVTTCWNKKDSPKHLVDFFVSKNITPEYFTKRIKRFS